MIPTRFLWHSAWVDLCDHPKCGQFFTRNIQDASTKLSGIICRPPQQIKFDYHDSNSLPVALRMHRWVDLCDHPKCGPPGGTILLRFLVLNIFLLWQIPLTVFSPNPPTHIHTQKSKGEGNTFLISYNQQNRIKNPP